MTIQNIRSAPQPNIENQTRISRNKSHSITAEKIEFVSNFPRELSLKLDKYGIDINPEKTNLHNTTDTPVIFAHRDQKGNINLDTGLYISDPKNGDKYGEFRFHEGRATKKYQVPNCTKLIVTEESLNKLRETYHEICGVTHFLSDVLELKPGKDLDIYLAHPEYYSYLSPMDANSNGFLIFPNAPYIDLNSLTEEPNKLKERRDGICLGAYAIHPNQNLSLIEKMGVPARFNGENIKENHTDNSRTLLDIAANTNVKYLASILDLDTKDIPMLEKLRDHIIYHLSETYDVDHRNDKVQLYFHFPPADVTATLHLHVRVNVADHPLNQARSFELSDIIDTLSNGKTINDLILSRDNGVLYTLVNENDSIRVIPEKIMSRNPHTLNLS